MKNPGTLPVQQLEMNAEQAVQYINRHIEHDFNYLRRLTSTQETTNLPNQVITDLTNIWEEKGYDVVETVDPAAKYWNGKEFVESVRVRDKVFEAKKDRSWITFRHKALRNE